MRVAYFDSSAITKLVVAEPESAALRAAVEGAQLVTSRVSVVEVTKAVGRLSPDLEVAGILSRFAFIELDEGLALDAASVGGPALRALAAVHVASALLLGDGVEAFVTYDVRQGAAARGAGLAVVAPGTAGRDPDGGTGGPARHRVSDADVDCSGEGREAERGSS